MSDYDVNRHLVLGGGPFGDLYNTCNQEIVNFIVSNGVKRGINFIDTSYWYGQGKSEERLGKVTSARDHFS